MTLFNKCKVIIQVAWFAVKAEHLPGGLVSRTASHTLIFRITALSSCSTWDSRVSELTRKNHTRMKDMHNVCFKNTEPTVTHLMDSSGGCEISNTNLSTGWCSLSMITTTTFSASFCTDNIKHVLSTHLCFVKMERLYIILLNLFFFHMWTLNKNEIKTHLLYQWLDTMERVLNVLI